MDFLLNNWVLSTILVPVILAFFKEDITNFINDVRVYRNRMFDDDGDPATGQNCYVQSAATGEFKEVTVAEYKFGLLASKRKVITIQPCPNQPDSNLIVPYTYKQWASITKGSIKKR